MSRFTGIRKIWTVSGTVSPSTTAYTAKDQFGTKITFANAVPNEIGSAKIISAKLVDLSMLQKRTKLLLFNQNLSTSASATGDNGALDIADCDMDSLVGVVDFSTGSFTALKDSAVSCVENINLGFDLPTGSNLYGVLETFGTGIYTSGEGATIFLDIAEM